MPELEYDDLLGLQSGVITRRQLVDLGAAPHDLERLLRKRELVRVHDGVFVDHTGERTWLQRAWVGVLIAWPAALAADSAIRAEDGPGRSGRDDSRIHVAVDRDRRVRLPRGYRLHRMSGLDEKVRWNASPPRVRIEEALVDLSSKARDDFAAISVLADAIQARRTTAARIRERLDDRARLPRRDFLRGVLRDIDRGTCSVLEHGYLTRVEAPHGIPVARRQLRDSSNGPLYRDVAYVDFDQLVELDGRLWHDGATQRDADLERDLDAAVDRLNTVRVGWGQVFERPCATAARIGVLLEARGWTGRARSCPDCRDGLPLAS
ncbi:hypothetical protein EUA93_10635 [Nocardioides oleivorans]|uniref:Type IV toxin-antitoxin system AbiEi family antitoxin domain-containing protein n=1 Tax=Nocardioides oleivorans TaxID=273676 RepID=A0A4Q2S2Z4_9ACTN|nr:type IV toxin-antitoxin system AbiEi family antitoxin domain-containing protein [Nocardioides oleivorans]RYB94764.1 hypothetical protein EUA93_10635 [Nocardioides oleivorans]